MTFFSLNINYVQATDAATAVEHSPVIDGNIFHLYGETVSLPTSYPEGITIDP